MDRTTAGWLAGWQAIILIVIHEGGITRIDERHIAGEGVLAAKVVATEKILG